MSDIQTSQFIDPDFAQVFHSWCNYYGEMWRSSTQSTVHLLLVHFIVWIVSIMWSLLKVAESQKSFRFASNLQKKRCQITLLSIFSFPFFQARGLAHFFGYLSKSKKLFAVKLPLLVILFLMVISELTTKQEELIKIITIQKVLVMFEDGFSKDCLVFESFKQGISSLKITEWSCNMALWKTIQIDWIFSLLKKKHTKNHPQSSKIYIEHACNIAWQV